MFYFDETMCKEILTDHLTNPRNINKSHDGYKFAHLKNPSCGDAVTVYVLLDKNIVKDITYEVTGCAICKASISILSELLIGKTLEEVDIFIGEFNKMVIGEEYDIEILKEASSLKGVFKTPPRIKCAILGYKAFTEAVRNDKDGL